MKRFYCHTDTINITSLLNSIIVLYLYLYCYSITITISISITNCKYNYTNLVIQIVKINGNVMKLNKFIMNIHIDFECECL